MTPIVTNRRSVANSEFQRRQISPSNKEWHGVWHYEDAVFDAAINTISTLLSALLPTASILALYFVEDLMARLAVTTVFTMLYALTLETVTRARRIDIFAVTVG